MNEIIGGKTLVHCKSGMSRSVSICIAYLIKYKKENGNVMGAEQALKFVKEKRSFAKPIRNFMLQLLHFEGWCNGSWEEDKFVKELTNDDKNEQEEAIQCIEKILELLKLQLSCDIR